MDVTSSTASHVARAILAVLDYSSTPEILAELLSGRPIMAGRNEVDQIHRIYKLCGSPSEEYWRKIRLPSNHMAKPQHKRKVREAFKDFSPEALSLVDRLLALDPLERLTATDALMSDKDRVYPQAHQKLEKMKVNQ